MDLKQLLERTKNLEPQDGRPILSFKHVGDAVVARYEDRRPGIKTKKNDSATALDIEVLESTITGEDGRPVIGKYSVWESTHLSMIFSQQGLEPGDVFILRLASINKASSFKKFYFQKVDDEPKKPTVDPSDDIGF